MNLNSINGKFNLRFELGGEILENGTIERVNQAVTRATEIYKQAIGNGELIVAIEEYETEYFDKEKRNKGYLSELLPLDKLIKFKGPFGQSYYEIDELGNRIEQVAEDELHCDLLIGKLIIDEESINKIIRGRANLEMGFDPAISQDIYYYSISNKVGFRIYDDRGCDVWSNDKEKLRPIYESLNNWILDYNRPEIDEYFK
ncbi:DUF3885 domain-containing protein [Aquimarina algiphila]|uniref:DUF3885 domain-containing protein n=1 Tax=Aquimarina algiphila TaxID=2047982 RepID=UPI00232C16FC|nr:DUF3885 domain-containing protein [Aquimarina algiphila]